ncbi:TetR/AcrR family transcriptional regulator [Phycicoccus sp. HDW14]|uniref:TetR/AcrR family transcriptional regulator n=1 Tax=Phycicoccus sp. HDW14 TaxID=2714941 RepID=UPI001408AC45|nr:TetR/AcrR family transcriptional regulator [Phycicoccus sp. HDW14]QIM21895.1 TetR/AcrR family transcriptional regulator [Phycicoccus sp. HDW14]
MTPPPPGRRERNKQEKLERIVAAASSLFAEHGVDDVTTQQIAEAADIGTGTLFLYARTKGELLLMVQNTHYEEALARGRAEAEHAQGAVEAVVALLAPVVECNRAHVGNGRVYLREMLFGDPDVPGHAAALAVVAETDRATVELIRRWTDTDEADAARQAGVIAAAMYVTMASAPRRPSSTTSSTSSVRPSAPSCAAERPPFHRRSTRVRLRASG